MRAVRPIAGGAAGPGEEGANVGALAEPVAAGRAAAGVVMVGGDEDRARDGAMGEDRDREDATTASPGSNRPTVLVADDDPAIASLVADVLREAGYAVVVAFDGAHALALAAVDPPDLLLADVQMPRLNGAELVRWIRARHPDLPVVLFSTVYDGLDVEGPAVRFLPKPFDLSALLDGVADALVEARRS